MGSRTPTTKRIMKEASELASQPSPDFHAAPLESDIFEWHFTIRGPPAPSPFEGGVYHGRIVLPPAYPLKPPSFRFLTASGRFEVNREICLSISGHHEESWQPAWGIRTALVAIRSFMDTDAKGQLGGMDASDEVRRRFAAQSKTARCATCGKSNEEITKEMDAAVKEAGVEVTQDEVPEQLKLAYREDLSNAEGKATEESKAASTSEPAGAPPVSQAVPVPAPTPTTTQTRPAAGLAPVPPAVQQQQRQPPARQDDGVPGWIDKAIYGVAIALLVLVWKKWFM